MTGIVETDQDKARYIVNAVDTALDLLEIVSRNPGKSLADLSRLTLLNKSRTMRFLVTLENRGFVRKDSSGLYFLALRSAIIGDRAREQMNELEMLRPVLDRLRDRTQETVQYRVLDGTQTICLAAAESKLEIRVHTEIGLPRELYVGSSKSILAFGGPGLLEKILAAPRTTYTQNTVVDADALQRQLTEIRKTGYAVSKGERIEGAVALGAPIFNPDGTVTSCLSLLGPEFRIGSRIEELGDLLVAAADEARQVLFGTG